MVGCRDQAHGYLTSRVSLPFVQYQIILLVTEAQVYERLVQSYYLKVESYHDLLSLDC